jgi:hypothetical protein
MGGKATGRGSLLLRGSRTLDIVGRDARPIRAAECSNSGALEARPGPCGKKGERLGAEADAAGLGWRRNCRGIENVHHPLEDSDDAGLVDIEASF